MQPMTHVDHAPLSPPARYPTTVRSVSEVNLFGWAEVQAFEPALAARSLTPYISEGRVEVLLLACSSRFKGKRFSELSLSVFVSDQADGATRDGVYPLTAFNSVRFFAWVERACARPRGRGDALAMIPSAVLDSSPR